MPVRKAEAVWNGSLKEGRGSMRFGSGAFEGEYSFQSRFEEGQGTNPEELIGAAHAGCFSMAFSSELGKAGFNPQTIETQAEVTLEKVDGGFKITKIHLITQAHVPEVDEDTFMQKAEAAKKGCPLSQLFTGAEISLEAKLVR
jgi:osmotically inducible protein OsmC